MRRWVIKQGVGRIPLLREEFAMGIAVDRSMVKQRYPKGLKWRRKYKINFQEHRYLLWARSEDNGAASICAALGIGQETYWWKLRQLTKYPALLVKWGCVVRLEPAGRNNPALWECLFCGSEFVKRDVSIAHAMLHVFEQDEMAMREDRVQDDIDLAERYVRLTGGFPAPPPEPWVGSESGKGDGRDD